MPEKNNNQSNKTEFFVNLNNPKQNNMIKANSVKEKKVIPTNMFIMQDGKQCPMTIMIDD